MLSESWRVSAMRDAIDEFLDECERKVGERKFAVPDNPRVHDAIRAMADAIGRNV